MLAREVGEPWLRAWALYNQGMELGWVQRETLRATAEMEATCSVRAPPGTAG